MATYNIKEIIKFPHLGFHSYAIFLLVLIALFGCNSASQEKLLFPEIKPWELKSLAITSQNDSVLDFSRKMCVWTVGQENLATNEALVSDFADQLTQVSYQKTIEGSNDSYTKYRVSENNFDYKIDIGLENKDLTVFVGSQEDSDVSYARFRDDVTIYFLDSSFAKTIKMDKKYWLPKTSETEPKVLD